jgi:glycogen debranching enzyme
MCCHGYTPSRVTNRIRVARGERILGGSYVPRASHQLYCLAETSSCQIMRRLLFLLVFSLQASAFVNSQQSFEPLKDIAFAKSPITITQLAVPRRPFTVVAERGAILGQQDGSFELWNFPYKIIQHAHLSVELDGYGVPIDLNPLAATIEVSPDHTTITYSHSAITVRQQMFVVRDGPAQDPPAVILFSIDSTRSGTLTLDFEPVMAPMWPAPQHGAAGASWLPIGSGGGFLLATDNPMLYGIVAMPATKPGVLAPYQERPQKHPLQFKIRFDAKLARKQSFPLIAMMSDGKEAINDASRSALAEKVLAAETRIPALYAQTARYYKNASDKFLNVETPDPSFNKAVQWAEIAIDQSQVRFHGETGLTAGWYTSADSLRPGFGWFFGRDTLWTLYGVHSYGDFALARNALEFLIRRQRADGKIMHEFSQTADLVDWKSFPYWYASADATPLFVMAMEDYVRSSGDVDFILNNWSNLQRAYHFTRTHDSDGDGIYDNKEGTGWVESWPPGMPNQEIYLAALDQQSAESYSRLAVLMNDAEASAAKSAADSIRTKLANYRANDGFYAFSRNRDGSYDQTATIFPSVAWWNGRLSLPQSGSMLSRWSSSEFLTDWGSREVSDKSSLYDPISYHQGSVWPLFTGWASMAEYHSNRPLAGYEHFLANARLTFISDLGGVTELLSGDLYEPLGRSSSHQMWSSAMVLTPAIRGVFGIESDVLHHRLTVSPHLPADWDHVALHHVPYGTVPLDITMARRGDSLEISIVSREAVVMCVDSNRSIDDRECKGNASSTHSLRIPLPGVEVAVSKEDPSLGARTSALQVTGEKYANREINLDLEAPAASSKFMTVRLNGIAQSALKVEGAKYVGGQLQIDFPAGAGYVTRHVKISW